MITCKKHIGSVMIYFTLPTTDKGGYSTTHIDFDQYIGYNITETTCNQAECHSNTSGSAQRPVFENHSSRTDCKQCHFANTTISFPRPST